MNDKEAIALIKKKDQRGFNFIYNKYIYQIYGYIYHMVKDKMIAEDISSETFYKLYKNIKKYKERGNFKAYLFRIAHNLVVDYYRKNKIEYSFDETIYMEKSEKNEDNTIDKNLIHVIEEKLQHLKRRDRSIIMLYYFEELDLKNIAQILNISASTAKVALFRAREKLKKEVVNEI